MEHLLVRGGYSGSAVRRIAEEVGHYWERPEAVRRLLRDFGIAPSDLLLSGVVASRLLGVRIRKEEWVLGCSGLRTLAGLNLPTVGNDRIQFRDPQCVVSFAHIPETVHYRMTRPNVLLVGLYHPEVFPLPRLHLGISDLAAALRKEHLGTVSLMDMQLNTSIADIVRAVVSTHPDILGVSATFGQHDVLVDLLETLKQESIWPTTTILGGSLPALDAKSLLQKYPNVGVCTGPGEPTILDVVRQWTEGVPLPSARYLETHATQSTRLTVLGPESQRVKRPTNRMERSTIPELDLLTTTLDLGGVMQLETSRGCTHACSFCPREHKGLWHGETADELDQVLPDISRIYDRYPGVARKVYVVDEEFVGIRPQGGSETRAKTIALALSKHGFRWEANSRIDQVYRPDRDRSWNLEHIQLWKDLLENGLDRCLFGVESGVNTILERFNKHTTSEQNVVALRILTTLGVPIRCTYITFDPLMTFEELEATYAFQGRRDILLRKDKDASIEDIMQRATNDSLAQEFALGLPLYTHISYMLVTMECLVGAPYTWMVAAAGLLGEERLSMGAMSSRYRDQRIGSMADWAQRWIDHNFSLDYTLKSLEKRVDGTERAIIRRFRYCMRDASYKFLGHMLKVVRAQPSTTGSNCFQRLAELRVDALRSELTALAHDQGHLLASDRREKLTQELERWVHREGWELING